MKRGRPPKFSFPTEADRGPLDRIFAQRARQAAKARRERERTVYGKAKNGRPAGLAVSRAATLSVERLVLRAGLAVEAARDQGERLTKVQAMRNALARELSRIGVAADLEPLLNRALDLAKKRRLWWFE